MTKFIFFTCTLSLLLIGCLGLTAEVDTTDMNDAVSTDERNNDIFLDAERSYYYRRGGYSPMRRRRTCGYGNYKNVIKCRTCVRTCFKKAGKDIKTRMSLVDMDEEEYLFDISDRSGSRSDKKKKMADDDKDDMKDDKKEKKDNDKMKENKKKARRMGRRCTSTLCKCKKSCLKKYGKIFFSRRRPYGSTYSKTW